MRTAVCFNRKNGVDDQTDAGKHATPSTKSNLVSNAIRYPLRRYGAAFDLDHGSGNDPDQGRTCAGQMSFTTAAPRVSENWVGLCSLCQKFEKQEKGQPNYAYFISHHPSATAADVVAIEIPIEVAISFAHSQYDTHALPRSA